jgi:hypothetical protein
MTKLNSLARAWVIGPEGGAEDGADGAGVGESAAGVDVLVVSSSWTQMEEDVECNIPKNCSNAKLEF